MTVLIMVGMVGLAPRAIGRFGPKAMTVTGLAVLAFGMTGPAAVDKHTRARTHPTTDSA